MAYRVTSNTGYPFYVGEGVAIDPHEPTVVDELTDEMAYQMANLNIVETDAEGKPIDFVPQTPAPETVPSSDYDAMVKERDALQGKLDKATGEAKDAKVASDATIKTLEGLLPTTASQIQNMGLDNLKALADYRKVKVDGDDKAAYVAALSPKSA